jgi:hypothetical protein
LDCEDYEKKLDFYEGYIMLVGYLTVVSAYQAITGVVSVHIICHQTLFTKYYEFH